jgi:Pro-kumamolisin, activation domain
MPKPTKNDGTTQIPPGYRQLNGSDRAPAPGAKLLGPAPLEETVSVRIIVRPRPDGPPMPNLDYFQKTPLGQRKYPTVEEFANLYGSAPADLDKIVNFATSNGLTVTNVNAGRRTVIVTGTVAQMNAAFAVTLNRYEAPRRPSRIKTKKPQPATYVYRGREGVVHLPEEIAPLVTAVLGLDNRSLGGVNACDSSNTSTLTVPKVTQLYNFPTNLASNQTIGIYNTGGNYDTTPGTGDIAKYYATLPSSYAIPTIQDVPAGSNNPALVGDSGNDYEITQDILISSTVAQGATIAVYFESDDETGVTDWLSKAVMPTGSEPTPTVLTTSFILTLADDPTSLPMDVFTAVTTALNSAAVRGITVFYAQGDHGSNGQLGTDSAGRQCHVQYFGTDQWATSCGGTTICNVASDLSSFDENVWNDTSMYGPGQTGGGVSDSVALPLFQSAAGVSPTSQNPDHGIRRGVPDIAGNASTNSGYPCFVAGAPFVANGTSAVAPLYAGLIAVINEALNQQVGYLNPTLYALGTQLGVDLGINVFRDITSGDNNPNDGSGAPYYTAGPGWDACTGWGSINGNALLSALQVLFTRSCTIVTDRDHFGQDEVDAARTQPGGAVFKGAFFITVDGFTPTQLGITNSTSLAAAPVVTFNPSTGVTNTCSSLTSDDPAFGPEVQRFRFGYDVNFGSGDSAFTSFSALSETVTLSTTYQGLPASAQVTFMKQPDPYINQGPQTWWLSNDILLFQVAEGGSQFGVPMGNDPFAFLSAVTSALENGTPQGTAGGQSFDSNTQEDFEVLTVAPQNTAHPPQNVYNFAVARVHYQALTNKAQSVRVFFRLFAANSTATDFQPGSTYERFPAVYPVPTAQYFQNVIPTLGASGGEYVSVPCFGEGRASATQAGSPNTLPSLQTPDGFNVRDLQKTGGPVHDTFYGCWLDINQSAPVLPAMVPAGNQNGPWPTGSGVTVEPLRQAFIVNEHQCIMAEIAFDPDPIATGTQPFNSDKFAQRNISWSYVANPGVAASRQALEPFEVRPTPAATAAGEWPDELMIDWNNVPVGQPAEIYLPAVDVAAVLTTAGQLYGLPRLTQVDAHTIGCTTGGVSYIPLPKGSGNGANFVGLLSVNLPYGIRKGQLYTVLVRQLTNATGIGAPPPPPPPPVPQILFAEAAVGAQGRLLKWRKVLGTFQVNIPVSTKELLLPREEQRLSIFRWIAEAMPPQRRWYPVFQRYLKGIAGRVQGFGGDPLKVLPSPTGSGKPASPPHREEHHEEFTGKIAALLFDHFGDFEGFVLETKEREIKFFSREKAMEELADRVWRDRLRITVRAEHHDPHRPLSITVHQPPAPFGN